ncbi:MAG: thiolase family protein [Armatimonadota bacterium]|jgi:acetyl-CoA C-acetyltransferase
MSETVIIDALRTPIGRFGGGLLEHSAADLATSVTRALIDRNKVPPAEVAEVIFGHVIQGGSNLNVARTAAIRAGLPETVCGSTVNMMCASGMRSVEMARGAIAAGEGDLFIAGGTESMSNAPFYVREMRWGNKLGSVEMIDAVMDEGLRCPITGMGMGLSAEGLADRTGITREEQDAWALRSQQRARAAIDEGRFEREIVEIPRERDEPLAVDEHPRETSPEALAGLRPAFRPDGCVTAGNASGINDGAAALLLASAGRARRQGWEPRARILGSAWAGVEPEVMGLGPVPAVRALCERTGLDLEEFDLIELNEAFAVQALAVMRELEMDEERVNVNGSGIALGHPIGATGARIIVTLLHEMERRDVARGLATLCVGGGMGMAMAIERT